MNFTHLHTVSKHSGVPVLEWSFFVPGMGGNIGDTDGAHNKRAIRYYVNEGGDVEIASDVVGTLNDDGFLVL